MLSDQVKIKPGPEKVKKTIQFGGSKIELYGIGERSITLLDYLFRHAYSSDADSFNARLRMEYRTDYKTFHCFRNDLPIYVGPTESHAARCMLESALYSLAYESSAGLMFHAAALEHNNRILLIPGISGAGKTTLACWLTFHGFRYMTDEMVFIPDGSRVVESFKRPFNVKTRGIHAIESFIDLASIEDKILRGGFTTLLPHCLVNPEPADPAATIGMILFPQYTEGADLNFEAITPADASSRMMGMLINARNLPGHGFRQTSQLVASVPSYCIKYGKFENVLEIIEERMDELAENAQAS